MRKFYFCWLAINKILEDERQLSVEEPKTRAYQWNVKYMETLKCANVD